MAAEWHDIFDPVLGTSVYVDGALAGKNVKLTLPSVLRKTIEYAMMGIDLPLPGVFEAMRLKIQHIGVDMGLVKIAAGAESHVYEVRFCQNKLSAGGKTKRVGCNAFMTGSGLGVPELSLEVGASTESELEVLVTSFKLTVDGEVVCDVDKTAATANIGGTDELNDIEQYL